MDAPLGTIPHLIAQWLLAIRVWLRGYEVERVRIIGKYRAGLAFH